MRLGLRLRFRVHVRAGGFDPPWERGSIRRRVLTPTLDVDEPNAVLSMTGGEDGTLRVFTHAHAGRAACEVVLAGHGGAVTSLALCRGEDRGWSLGLDARRDVVVCGL